MPKPSKTPSFQFQKDEEIPLSFKEKWLPKVKYYSSVLFVISIWLVMMGCVYFAFDLARTHIKLVDDVP